MDVVDPVEDVAHHLQPRAGAAGQVDLRDVTGHDDLAAEPDPAGQVHPEVVAVMGELGIDLCGSPAAAARARSWH